MNILKFFSFLFLTFTSVAFCKDPKTLVLIIASDDSPFYVLLQKMWRSYMHSDREHFDCYFVKAHNDVNDVVKITEDTIWTNSIEQYEHPGLIQKTLIALENVPQGLDHYDYVFRGNLSSFVYFPRLLEELKRLPKHKCYAGIVHKRADNYIGWGWVCGAGIILSKDLVNVMLDYKNYLLNPHLPIGYLMDDLAIADLFQKLRIRRIDMPGVFEIGTIDDWNDLTQTDIFNKFYHLRIKTIYQNRAEIELQMQQNLIKYFYNIDVEI